MQSLDHFRPVGVVFHDVRVLIGIDKNNPGRINDRNSRRRRRADPDAKFSYVGDVTGRHRRRYLTGDNHGPVIQDRFHIVQQVLLL